MDRFVFRRQRLERPRFPGSSLTLHGTAALLDGGRDGGVVVQVVGKRPHGRLGSVFVADLSDGHFYIPANIGIEHNREVLIGDVISVGEVGVEHACLVANTKVEARKLELIARGGGRIGQPESAVVRYGKAKTTYRYGDKPDTINPPLPKPHGWQEGDPLPHEALDKDKEVTVAPVFEKGWRERLAEREQRFKARFVGKRKDAAAPALPPVGPSQPRIDTQFAKVAAPAPAGRPTGGRPKLPAVGGRPAGRVPANQPLIQLAFTPVAGRVAPAGGAANKTARQKRLDRAREAAKYKDNKKFKQPTMEAFFNK